MSDDTLKIITEILQNNKDKSFVKRILYPENYPVLNEGNGNFATHKMAFFTNDDGTAVVVPTILYDGDKLVQYEPKEALERAIKTNNFIKFDNAIDAEYFTKNYKSVWGQQVYDSMQRKALVNKDQQ
jgi:hypothetical protein